MRVLAFDACLGAVSAAAGILRADGHWHRHAGAFVRVDGGHAEALMPMLDRVMGEAGLAFSDLDTVVATIGPGGFTGVRVAVAAARGFVLATSARGVGLSTLDALALGARTALPEEAASRPLFVAVDGRRGMVFFARYEGDAHRATPELLSVAEAAQRIAGTGGTLVGSAAAAVAEAAGMGPVADQFAALQPDARLFARIALAPTLSASLKPIYLRPPDAKAQTSFVLPRAPA